MSEKLEGQGGGGAVGARRAGEPAALPQWAIDRALRPAVRSSSRLLWRIRLRGDEHIPQSGGLVIAANHQTYLDPFWISIPVYRPVRYLAWSEAFKVPVVGRLMEWLGAWPLVIERGNPTAYRRSLRWLARGGAVMIFPEGSRAFKDGRPARFKSGAARLALEAGVPVLPVTIRGGNQAWPRGQLLPRPGRVEIIYHPVRRLAPLPGEDVRACAQRETEALAEIITREL
ncbi:MAG TPA: lysophospholipid acyltransferase family protein [Pyrinomonadaceae bacterium]|nr:lysophospholipid acyltransferase family protein [Pyrinomonadaceae bacterium]